LLPILILHFCPDTERHYAFQRLLRFRINHPALIRAVYTADCGATGAYQDAACQQQFYYIVQSGFLFQKMTPLYFCFTVASCEILAALTYGKVSKLHRLSGKL